ncbi:porin [Noviherbaspirillum galbum]|uniref:Porin n=1 Tax=Noviherbaspirillum galbum TaxID=2709383 RepID=A0A6B3SFV8_9BURK|nr:porin [Noviherbaspirillum galbum]NEX59490.1 hypothetical protein [Noviherbaspirillum galbum]
MQYNSRLIGAIALMATSAMAAEPGAPNISERPVFTFSGFGTLGAVHSSERDADFTTHVFKPNGAGASHDWSFAPDSLLGGQVNARFGPRLSAVLQVVAEQRYDKTWRPQAEWANLKYQFTPSFSARIGRIALPGFLAADYRKVGYAIPWVRAPRDVYLLGPVTSNDGIDASHTIAVGEGNNTLQAYYGRKDIRSTYQDGDPILARDSFGIVDTLEVGPLTLRAGYQTGRMSMGSSKDFFDRVRQFGSAGGQLADRYDLWDKTYRLMSFGGNIDQGRWFLTTEWAQLKTNSWAGDGQAWYAGAGYRIGHVTPFASVSRVRLTSPASDPGLPVASLPAFLRPATQQANGVLDSLLGAIIPDQRTLSAGMRWDAAKNTAVKVQVDHMDLSTGSGGALKNLLPGFSPGGQVNLFTVSVDFVF